MIPWLRELLDRGAGEILLTSMDHDGTKAGFDLDGLREAREAVRVPIVASGGAGCAAHFVEAAATGATGLLAASLFHFRELSINEVKGALAAAGYPVRLTEGAR
jgi:cyclase